MHDISNFISWVIHKETNDRKDQMMWELYLHTGAMTGISYKEWKEGIDNGR
jgi:hypothetical protein